MFCQVLCTVKSQNSEQILTTTKFAGFHYHYPLLIMLTRRNLQPQNVHRFVLFIYLDDSPAHENEGKIQNKQMSTKKQQKIQMKMWLLTRSFCPSPSPFPHFSCSQFPSRLPPLRSPGFPRMIFDKCIKDLLGDKTRVLSFHQEHHMREADEVIVLYKGSVLGKGSFSELQKHDLFNTTIDRPTRKLW